MSATKARRLDNATQALTEHALRQLIDHYRDCLDPNGQRGSLGLHLGDLSWIGGIYGQVRQGYPLKDDQIAQVSRIRGELARRHHGR